MTRAARIYDVIFIEEPMPLQPGETAHMEITSVADGVSVAVPRLAPTLDPDGQEHAIASLLDSMLKGEPAANRVKWYYTPMALPFSAQIPAGLVVYDCMDELSAFAGASPRLRRLEQALFRHADVVFTGGHSLFEAKAHLHEDISPEPSSIDMAHFSKARTASCEPAEQRHIPRPRVGFFGVIDERMNLELVRSLAALKPEWHFVMIGPVVKIAPETLPQAANIHWMGSRDYKDLPQWISGWQAGFMPFALNESTRYISPTKTPEFLAAGVPVVSTSITDVIRPYAVKGLVEIADTAEGLALALERAMQRPRAPWLASVDAELARTSWDLTWQRMAARMRKSISSKAKLKPAASATAIKQAASHV
jgi:glycosyltransferase involved in cell wall biosynthesis